MAMVYVLTIKCLKCGCIFTEEVSYIACNSSAPSGRCPNCQSEPKVEEGNQQSKEVRQ